MHALLKFVCWLLIGYVAYCSLLFLLQRQIMFPRSQIPPSAEYQQNIVGLEKLWLDTGYGNVEAWLIPPSNTETAQPVPAVIFGHGNGELIDFWPQELNKFTQLGMALLLVEYPGYGRSQGVPSQVSITQTFISAYDILVSRPDIDASRIVLVGRSLGGGAVCALSQKRPSAALILMSAFTSARSFAKKFLVPAFLVRDAFDNLSAVANYPAPVLIIHGKHDEIIPFSHAIALHEAAKSGKLVAYDAGHNDCPPDWDVFWRDIASFLKSAGII